jgi:DNA-binding GntR family transcriptional regulator
MNQNVNLLGQPNYQRVRDVMRNDIITGQFAPGARLKISDLVKRYGLSAMPIREALQQLQGEGLVVLLANKGASVRQIDEQFLWKTYEIRKALEIYFITRMAERVTPADVQHLRAMVVQQESALAATNEEAVQNLDCQFHAYSMETGGNDEAVNILKRSYDVTMALRLRFGRSQAQRERMPRDHTAIIDALADHDAERAGRLISQHIDWAFTDLADQMRLEDDSIRKGLHKDRQSS